MSPHEILLEVFLSYSNRFLRNFEAYAENNQPHWQTSRPLKFENPVSGLKSSDQ